MKKVPAPKLLGNLQFTKSEVIVIKKAIDNVLGFDFQIDENPKQDRRDKDLLAAIYSKIYFVIENCK